MAAVRCPSPDCGWTGKRKTDAPRDAALEKPCPKCGGSVKVGGPAPSRIDTLPSGIEVAFWDEWNIETGLPQRRTYRVPGIDGEKLPSVSAIAGIYEKPGLVPSAVNLTLDGVIALAELGVEIKAFDRGQLKRELIDQRTWYDSVWGAARDRGRIAHDHLLHLLRDDRVAKLSEYDEDIRPWIAAGMKCALDFDFDVHHAEYFVASLKHGFAGRGDLDATPRRSIWQGERCRIDFKTVTEWKFKSNGEPLPPFDESLIALAGYDVAAPESGYPESEARLIIQLGPDGDYRVFESHATADVFLASLTAYNERRWLSTGRPEGK